MSEPGYINEHELYHFVGRKLEHETECFNLLQKILRLGSLRHPPFEDGGSFYGYRFVFDKDHDWQGSLELEKQASTDEPLFGNIVCFADIPREHLNLHASKYSKFGLAFSKKFLAERGARPVLYIPYVGSQSLGMSIHGRDALSDLTSRLKEFADGQHDKDEKLKRDMLMKFFAYIKAFDITLPANDPLNYYYEREWRMLGYLNFNIDDVSRVLVPARFVGQMKQSLPLIADRVEVF